MQPTWSRTGFHTVRETDSRGQWWVAERYGKVRGTSASVSLILKLTNPLLQEQWVKYGSAVTWLRRATGIVPLRPRPHFRRKSREKKNISCVPAMLDSWPEMNLYSQGAVKT